MPKGRYFFIKSFMNGKVLDIDCANPSAGTTVFMYSQKTEKTDNQLWTYHTHTHTIRSKLNGYCLDVIGGNIQMQPYGPGVQEWLVENNTIMTRDNPDKVLDIVGEKKDDGAKLCVYTDHAGENQRWNTDHVNSPYFYIKSYLNELVLDIKASNRGSGAEVIMWNKGKALQDNQLWYEDEEGWIRSKLSDDVLDSSGLFVAMQPYESGNPDQQWEIEGEFIRNHAKKDEVLDISGAKAKAGASLCSYRCHGKDNQRWKFEYV